MEEYLLKTDFREFTMEFKAEMEKLQESVRGLNESVNGLRNSIDMMKVTSIAENDLRYRKKDDMRTDAMLLLDDPGFIAKCQTLIKRTINEHACDMRDNSTKWIVFIKGAIGLVIMLAALYGGNTVIQTQKSNQKALINLIEQKGE